MKFGGKPIRQKSTFSQNLKILTKHGERIFSGKYIFREEQFYRGIKWFRDSYHNVRSKNPKNVIKKQTSLFQTKTKTKKKNIFRSFKRTFQFNLFFFFFFLQARCFQLYNFQVRALQFLEPKTQGQRCCLQSSFLSLRTLLLLLLFEYRWKMREMETENLNILPKGYCRRQGEIYHVNVINHDLNWFCFIKGFFSNVWNYGWKKCTFLNKGKFKFPIYN